MPVPDGLDGLRLDAALSRIFGFSRATAATLVDTGGVTVDGRARDRSDRVTAGAWLEVDMPEPPAPPSAAPEPVPGLTVVHADDDIVVVDKPVGVAAMGHRLSTSGAAERQGVVHRLDVGTTGLMVLAKSERAYRVLKDAFRDRTVDKRYAALVQGHPDPTRGTIDAPIDRHPGSDWKFAVVAGGRPSVTHYDTIEAFRAATLLDVKLETGRTHQIRVHLAAVRHPLVGDLTYGADPTLAERLGLHRQWLHAARLGFEHPATGTWVEFTSPYPDDLARALALVSE